MPHPMFLESRKLSEEEAVAVIERQAKLLSNNFGFVTFPRLADLLVASKPKFAKERLLNYKPSATSSDDWLASRGLNLEGFFIFGFNGGAKQSEEWNFLCGMERKKKQWLLGQVRINDGDKTSDLHLEYVPLSEIVTYCPPSLILQGILKSAKDIESELARRKTDFSETVKEIEKDYLLASYGIAPIEEKKAPWNWYE